MCSQRIVEKAIVVFAILFTLCGIIFGFLYIYGVHPFITKDIFAGITLITFSVTGIFAILGTTFVLFLSLCFFCCKPPRSKRVQPIHNIIETV